MNRRSLLKSAITIGLVASIIKGDRFRAGSVDLARGIDWSEWQTYLYNSTGTYILKHDEWVKISNIHTHQEGEG